MAVISTASRPWSKFNRHGWSKFGRRQHLATLRHFDNHKERTAATLGISLKTLYNRLKDYSGDMSSTDNSESSMA